MRQFDTFGHQVWYIPSMPCTETPVTDCMPFQNELHEMVDQCRIFLYGFDKEY